MNSNEIILYTQYPGMSTTIFYYDSVWKSRIYD